LPTPRIAGGGVVFVHSLLALALSLGTAHPHLFFNAADVPALRDAAATTHKPIADHYLATVAAHLSDPPPTPSDYGDARFLGNQVAVWGFAYQLSGDPRYADKARSQILTYLTWADWSFGQGMDLIEAHMLLGVAVAYDLIYETLSAVDQQAIATRLGTEAQKMSLATPTAWWADQYTQNHNWIDTAGLGLAALALSGEDVRAPVWLAAAEANLQRLSLVLGPIADGSFHEGGPYEVYGLSMALPFWTALARTGADYTNLGILKGYGGFRLGAMVPDQPRALLLPYGDFTGWPTQGTIQILRYAAGRFGDRTAEAVAQAWLTGGRGSFVPELWYELFEFLYYAPSVQALPRAQWPLDSSFPDAQAAVLKSSWNNLDLQLGFKAGPYGGRANFDRLKIGGAPGGWLAWGHDHNDDMSFWLFGNGVWLAPEAMGYTAGNNISATNPANYTSYHNSLLVDGNGLLGDVRASDSNWNNPWFFARDAVPLLQATGTADYAFTGGRGANLFDPALGVSRWDRLVVLARHRYALVRDDFASSTPRLVDWVCHFSDGVSVDTGTGWLQGIAKNGQSLGVRVIAPAQWSATTGAQTATLMSKFDPDGSTAWARVRPLVAAAETQFLTALVPVSQAAWSSRPAIAALQAADSGAGAVIAPGSALEERWIFSRPGAAVKAAADLQLSSALAGMAARSAGRPSRALLVGPGSLSDQGGARLLLSSQSARSIEVDLQGTTLVASGDAIADFRAFAPGATAATVNGAPVAVSFEGNLLVYLGGAVATPDGGTPAPDGGAGFGGAPTPPDGGAPFGSVADGGAPGVALSGLSGKGSGGCAGGGAASVWAALAGLVLLRTWRRSGK
jgi:hypothetical protein